MAAYTEIETKLSVPSHEPVRMALKRLAAESVSVQFQQDIYFDTAQRSFIETDRCLRLRRQKTGPTEQIYLTYKGPRQVADIKKRQEIELEVGDANQAEHFLSALGYRRILIVEKERDLWRYGNCHVALDRLAGLGTFVEIEGPDDHTIRAVQESIGLKDSPHVQESYAALLARQRQTSDGNR
ncbi:MAG: class IV adenylate cyclase [Planctomycetes bacterium]|nr:class IV adenylate cyclase [Planctomycetota bacterium]